MELPSVYRAVLATVYRFRFIDATHAHWLHFDARESATAALTALFADGYLVRFPLISAGLAEPVWAYALSQRGAGVVASELGIDVAQIRWRRWHNRVSVPFIEHRLAVNTVRAAVEGAQLVGRWKVGTWRYEPIGEAPHPITGLPFKLIPDAYFWLQVGERRIHCLLEADLGTVSYRRVVEKMKLYISYRQSLWFRRQIGGRSFRVLWVSSTAMRSKSLCHRAERAGLRGLAWLAPLNLVHPSTIKAPIWSVGALCRASRASLAR